jgi:hypothetical protein
LGGLPSPAYLERLDPVYCSAECLVRRLAQLCHNFIAELTHCLLHRCLVFVDVYGSDVKAEGGGVVEGVQDFFVSFF